MKLPAALVASVMIWSVSKYLPTYFIEVRKMEMLEQRMQLETAKQVAILRELKTQAAPAREVPTGADKFY